MASDLAEPSGADRVGAGTEQAHVAEAPLRPDPADAARVAERRRRWPLLVLAALVVFVASGIGLVQYRRHVNSLVCADIGLGGYAPAATPEAELEVFLTTPGDRLLPPTGPPDVSAWHRSDDCTQGAEVGFELDGDRPPDARLRIVVMTQRSDGQWSVRGGYV